MWKQISKFDYVNFTFFCMKNHIPHFSVLTSNSNYKREYVSTSFVKIHPQLDGIELPIFREVIYSSGRSCYFCNEPLIQWFKYNIKEVKNEK